MKFEVFVLEVLTEGVTGVCFINELLAHHFYSLICCCMYIHLIMLNINILDYINKIYRGEEVFYYDSIFTDIMNRGLPLITKKLDWISCM